MGNCINKQSLFTWDSDDWSFEEPEKQVPAAGINDNAGKVGGVEEVSKEESLGGGKAGTVVKIRITKNQLQELLERVNVHGLSTEQLLSQLMSTHDQYQLGHRQWRPTLQSIPEVN